MSMDIELSVLLLSPLLLYSYRLLTKCKDAVSEKKVVQVNEPKIIENMYERRSLR